VPGDYVSLSLPLSLTSC